MIMDLDMINRQRFDGLQIEMLMSTKPTPFFLSDN